MKPGGRRRPNSHSQWAQLTLTNDGAVVTVTTPSCRTAPPQRRLRRLGCEGIDDYQRLTAWWGSRVCFRPGGVYKYGPWPDVSCVGHCWQVGKGRSSVWPRNRVAIVNRRINGKMGKRGSFDRHHSPVRPRSPEMPAYNPWPVAAHRLVRQDRRKQANADYGTDCKFVVHCEYPYLRIFSIFPNRHGN